jgi:phage gp36-like protein
MPYVTPAQLADGPGSAKELADLFAVDELLLLATIDAGDRSSWSADERAHADRALASINRFIVRADGEVNTRLVRRGYTLPLSSADFPVLTTWSRAITRYHIQPQRDKTNEESGRIERDYREALRALDQLAAGKLSLGPGDPLEAAAANDGAVRIVSNPRIFSRDSLGRL